MNIPYAMVNFADLRRGHYFYADKTRFIPRLEDPACGRRYVLFLRPRRFGKTTFLSLLEHYYDVARADQFAELFSGLSVGDHPTGERNSYFILRLDFSGMVTDQGMGPMRASFVGHLRAQIGSFFRRYGHLLPEQARAWPAVEARAHEAAVFIEEFLALLQGAPHRLYLLIDEHDSFTNDLVARGDFDAYKEVLCASGFVRGFFQKLKAATGSVIGRLFMTGVSPVMVNDMTSGFNIINSISLEDEFHDLCGLTQAEVEGLLDQVLATPGFTLDRDRILDDLRRYYDGYRFSATQEVRLYNPAMVLYFMAKLRPPDRYPLTLLDMNVRTDHTRLHTLLFTREGAVREQPLAQIRTLLSEGAMSTQLHDLFRLEQAYDEKFFASYLYYLGLLTIEDQEDPSGVRLRIPNAVIQEIYGEMLHYILETASRIKVNQDALRAATGALALSGRLEPLLRLLCEQVLRLLSNRDLIKMDERALKVLLLSYLSLSEVFFPFSELEIGRGYGDLVLTPSRRYAEPCYGILLELKYLPLALAEAGGRRKGGKKGRRRTAAAVPGAAPGAAPDAAIEGKFAEAEEQLRRYLAEPRLAALRGAAGWKAFSIVQVGTHIVYYRELGQATAAIPIQPG